MRCGAAGQGLGGGWRDPGMGHCAMREGRVGNATYSTTILLDEFRSVGVSRRLGSVGVVGRQEMERTSIRGYLSRTSISLAKETRLRFSS